MSSPTRNRVTRSQTKQDSSTKHDKSPAPSTQPPDDVNIPTLITHEMTYADVNKIAPNNLRTYLSWWTKQQGTKISAGSITNYKLQTHRLSRITRYGSFIVAHAISSIGYDSQP